MIYLHIGLPRTGSTYLQKCVFPKLKEIKYYYKPNWYFFDRNEKILVSNELITSHLNFEELNWIKTYNFDFKIVYFKRDYESWVKSMYANFSRYEPLPFEEFKVIFPESNYIVFNEKIKSYDGLFIDYNEFNKNNKKIVDEICEYMEIPMIEKIKNKRLNESKKTMSVWR